MLSNAERVEDFLAELALLAVADAALSCGLSVPGISSSRLLAASSDEFARQMDESQYQLDDGPCLSALRDNVIIEITDIATDSRWPDFRRRGRAEGAGASLSIPLSVGDRPVGALNLYARAPGAFTGADRTRAEALAAHAAGAVALAARLAEHEERTRHLRTALTSRSVIDRAVGILMGRHHVGAAAGFELLRQASQQTNTKLREIAVQLITDTTGHAPDPEPADTTSGRPTALREDPL
jgi:GAF domain-containing protein